MAASPPLSDQAEALSALLDVPLVAEDAEAPWCLFVTREALELRNHSARGPLRISTRADSPRRVSRRDPLGRAMGAGQAFVVDATAGLGGDTMLIAQMGFELVAIEQSPLVSVLLTDRLYRAGVKVPVTTGDAADILQSLDPPPDVVYIDPMFPPRRRKSALARKEMVALAELTASSDATDRRLFAAALGVARQRVVVKRLPESPDIGGIPSHSHRGKVVRYDVYLT